jgi:hypothetical protein
MHMLAIWVLGGAGVLFVVCQVLALWAPGRAVRAYNWAKAFALLPLVPFVLALLAMFNAHSHDALGWGLLAGVCLAAFVGAVLNLVVCALLAGREALRSARASLDNVPELGLTPPE